MTKTSPSDFKPQTSDFILVKDFLQDFLRSNSQNQAALWSFLAPGHSLIQISSKIYLWFVLSWLSIVKARSHSVFATPKYLAQLLKNPCPPCAPWINSDDPMIKHPRTTTYYRDWSPSWIRFNKKFSMVRWLYKKGKKTSRVSNKRRYSCWLYWDDVLI